MADDNIIEDLEHQVLDLIDREDYVGVSDLINSLHYSDTVNILEILNFEKRNIVLTNITDGYLKECIFWFYSDLIHNLIEIKGIDYLVKILAQEDDIDELTSFINNLDESYKEEILSSISLYKKEKVEHVLSYPKDSVARIMHSKFISVPNRWKLKEVISYLQDISKVYQSKIPNRFFDIFIVDEYKKPIAMVSLDKILTSNGSEAITDLVSSDFITIPFDMDQEEVALLFRNRDLISAPVTGKNGEIIGVVNISDIVDVIYKEYNEDVLSIAGISPIRRVFLFNLLGVSFNRLKWLFFNFTESFIIPIIVTVFATTISKVVIVTAIIQMVISVSGNAGLQSLAVILRELSLKLITPSNVMSKIRREIEISLVIGTIFAIIACIYGIFLAHQPMLGAVVFLAMILNVVLGVSFGVFYPLFFKKLGFDPATASSIFVTTTCDISGFFLVLFMVKHILNIG